MRGLLRRTFIQRVSMSDSAGGPAHLDREAYSRVLKLKALRVAASRSEEVRNAVKPHLLTVPRVKPIQCDAAEGRRLILLKEELVDALPVEVESVARREDVDVVDFELELGYDRLTAAEILGKLLPKGVVIPTAFETVGRLAHLNLRPEHMPYKHAIGHVFLDKNPHITTVINKVGTVESAFRVMEYEVLAGQPSLETEVRQSGCCFRLDFGKVYWNSRLEHEHGRLVEIFRSGETIVDLMSGVGPFAIPAAKKGCSVIANDKNPESYRYLRANLRLNHVLGDVVPLNMDARDCLKMLLGRGGEIEPHLPENYVAEIEADRAKRRLKRSAKKRRTSETPPPAVPTLPLKFQHVVMNYPQHAIDFLDVFRDVFAAEIWSAEEMPWIHCYAFMREDESPESLRAKCAAVIGAPITAEVYVVRDVAPAKVMVCISFQLPYDVAAPTATFSDVLPRASR